MLITAIKAAYEANQAKIALVIGDRQWPYLELMSAVEEQAAQLQNHGVCPGDCLLSVLPNGWHATLMLLVAAKLQLTYVPLPLSSTKAAIKTAIKSVQAGVIILWQPLLDELAFNYSELLLFTATANRTFIRFENSNVVQLVAAHQTESDEVLAERPFILTMTSGSTGDPKPIALTQAVKLRRAQAAIQLYSLTADDTTLIATPLYHSLAQRLLLVSLLSGGTAVVLMKHHQAGWLESIAEHRVTFTISVSSQLAQLAASDQDFGDALRSLKTLVSSSALLDTAIKRQLKSKINCRFHECYGASEVAIVSNAEFTDSTPLGTVGKALADVNIKIVGDDGASLPANSVGEIWVQSPYAFSGYFRQPEKTAQANDGGYFKTGDLGYLDNDGYLYFAGRKKEIIITGGINVYPQDVEAAVKTLSGVADAAAFPYPDEKLGEVVACALVAKPATIINSSVFNMKLLDVLADYQLPRRWFVVEELPKTALGKLQRYQLANLLRPDETQPALAARDQP